MKGTIYIADYKSGSFVEKDPGAGKKQRILSAGWILEEMDNREFKEGIDFHIQYWGYVKESSGLTIWGNLFKILTNVPNDDFKHYDSVIKICLKGTTFCKEGVEEAELYVKDIEIFHVVLKAIV